MLTKQNATESWSWQTACRCKMRCAACKGWRTARLVVVKQRTQSALLVIGVLLVPVPDAKDAVKVYCWRGGWHRRRWGGTQGRGSPRGRSQRTGAFARRPTWPESEPFGQRTKNNNISFRCVLELSGQWWTRVCDVSHRFRISLGLVKNCPISTVRNIAG